MFAALSTSTPEHLVLACEVLRTVPTGHCTQSFGFAMSPESRQQGNLSANAIGNTPTTLYILVDDVDGTFNKAVATGGKALMPVMDMFWGDRCGMLADPDGNKWMIATHKAEPTEAEMAEAMQQMAQGSQSESQSAAAGAESEY
jgi:Glyoxalase/Bleomycin resistance protein/Dioxygenase superfamily